MTFQIFIRSASKQLRFNIHSGPNRLDGVVFTHGICEYAISGYLHRENEVPNQTKLEGSKDFLEV